MAYIYLIPIDDDTVKIGSHSGHLGKLVKRYQTSILKENIAQGWAYKIEDNAKTWAEGMIATLIKRKQDLIGWIEGEKYDKDVSKTFHLLACDLCLPNTKTSIASVIIASVKRQEEKLAKKEKRQKDREYMRQVREDLRQKAQEAKELAKMERKGRKQEVHAQERSRQESEKQTCNQSEPKELITFLQLPTQKNRIEYGAKKYCLWQDFKSHLSQKGFKDVHAKSNELPIMSLSLKEENIACGVCSVKSLLECSGGHVVKRNKRLIIRGCRLIASKSAKHNHHK